MKLVLSALFVPGSRPDRFDKAVSSGADAVVLDLEDAVPTDSKASARESIEHWLSSHSRAPVDIMLRINPVSGSEFREDAKLLERIVLLNWPLDAVLVAKVESKDDLDSVAERIPSSIPFVALIESARGLTRLGEIASHQRVSQLAFGAADFSVDIGSELSERALLHARSQIVLGSAANDLMSPLDSPCFDTSDSNVIRRHAMHGRELGFGGALCIHPFQIPHVASGYSPSEPQILWATGILAASSSSGASRVGAEMVDAPIRKRAQRILDINDALKAGHATTR